MTTLYLIRGLPGSGKTTLAKQLLRGFLGNVSHWETDMFMEKEPKFDGSKLAEFHAKCLEETKKDLLNNISVIVSNTFVRKWEMQPYLDFAAKYRIPVQIIECKGQFTSVHNVPSYTLDRMKKNWENF